MCSLFLFTADGRDLKCFYFYFSYRSNIKFSLVFFPFSAMGKPERRATLVWKIVWSWARRRGESFSWMNIVFYWKEKLWLSKVFISWAYKFHRVKTNIVTSAHHLFLAKLSLSHSVCQKFFEFNISCSKSVQRIYKTSLLELFRHFLVMAFKLTKKN